ncbi:cytochrome o ubiquinol oxidase subunit III (plasmid) [Lichenicola cladoniae]|uniref:Cytochrome bo(3) ubiquinol oxidase subunit 3 n=1 Tax=Lichenicola cladoniae TaxID=1484109 RepID=A0A6M8HXX0_9PROT|nr:cytochrome c oxidase subunit 3 [Lichenicola cladoniae]NPD68971.1 cytochrome o ubiquinol oxidase subunit III [Acetobacteraceae bacterium]QKE93252.1 cytochrome o ubiquinol oxidase subunit III [Lichenicola cladoniae]
MSSGPVSPALRHAGLNLKYASREEAEQIESDVFGFWVFLMSDAVIFALLFALFGTSLEATVGGPTLASVVKLAPAFIETALLLTSSFTFGMASIELKRTHKFTRRHRHRAVGWLLLTWALGIAFLGMEAHDFVTMAGEGAVPDRSFFLSAYTVLIGTHGLHVLTAVIWLPILLMQMYMFGLDRPLKVNLIRLSLFWHFLDIVWIAIFSIVFLQGAIR